MELRYVLDESGNTKTFIREKVYYKTVDIDKYRELFNQIKQLNYIKAETFEDKIWYLENLVANKYMPITFDLDIYSDIQLALKCFVVAQLSLGKRSDTVIRNLQYVKKIIFETNGFNNVEKFYELISNTNDSRKVYLSTRATINFLSFYKHPNTEQFIDISYSVADIGTKSRELPHFQDILIFDSIINTYFRETPEIEHIKFKPVQIWWSLTTILPMRPSEFLLLSFNCVEKESDGSYWITVPRIKEAKDSPTDSNSTTSLSNQTFQVPKEIFDLISEFRLWQLEMKTNSKFLISYDFYKSTLGEMARKKASIVDNRINTHQFNKMLEKFYSNVVNGIYNEIFKTKIVSAHTRHLAIINMFLQGFNLLSIAKMAGHLDLRSADNYYSHAKSFANSYVYNFVTASRADNIGRKMSDGFLGWRRDVLNQGLKYSIEDLTSEFLKVDFGYCRDKANFPSNCGEDCRPCPYFIFKPSVTDYNAAIKWLDNYSEELENNIEIVLESMIQTSKSLNGLFSPLKEEAFKSKARELQTYMDHKIRTDLILSGVSIHD